MRRRSVWLAWSVVAVFVGSVAGLLALSLPGGSMENPADTALLLVAFAAFTLVGALILAHRPGNPIGWIFAAAGLLATTGGLAEAYARSAFQHSPAWPGAVAAAWWASWTWFPALAFVVVFTPLLFPTGRPPSSRWRPVVWLGVAGTLTMTLLAAVQPTLLVDGRPVANPLAAGPFGNPEEGTIGMVLLGVLASLLVAAIVSLVVRFRRSRGDERQQLKWFTYACALLPLTVLADVLPATAGDLLFSALIALPPVAAGIALLRYRLYDIDRLINRTLVYALLTALLAGVYTGIVLVLAQLFGAIGGRTPGWVVAGATLAVAALFQPARRRIQGAVDRRFNRRRYDAGRTIEAFSVRLRDEIDLRTLSAELVSVVEQTMQPTTVSLWIRRSG